MSRDVSEDYKQETEIQHQEDDILEDIVKPNANELSLREVACKRKRKGRQIIMAPSLVVSHHQYYAMYDFLVIYDILIMALLARVTS